MGHVHRYERIAQSGKARCTVKHCRATAKLEDLVYLGDAPKSVGSGSTWHGWRV